MDERVGVQAGRICPGCGQENSVPLVFGMPSADDVEQAERGALCQLEWGSESDPTADEAELAALIGVGYDAVVRALGTGWRRQAPGDDGVAWFVSGEPAQVSIGVQGPWFVLARPLTSWGEHRPGPLMGDGPRYTGDDVLHQPHLVAEEAEAIASHRRRSFRWCRSCRRSTAPESFVAAEALCQQCSDALAALDGERHSY